MSLFVVTVNNLLLISWFEEAVMVWQWKLVNQGCRTLLTKTTLLFWKFLMFLVPIFHLKFTIFSTLNYKQGPTVAVPLVPALPSRPGAMC